MSEGILDAFFFAFDEWPWPHLWLLQDLLR